MRVNVYSQELTPEVVEQEKISNTGEIYKGVSLILHSSVLLHHPPEDDDRSAVTFWLPKSGERRQSMADAFRRIADVFEQGIVCHSPADAPSPPSEENPAPSEPPYLSPSQIELLSYLSGELAEASAAVAKILRHGFFSFNPDNQQVRVDKCGVAYPNNRNDLEKELSHVLVGIDMLVKNGKISSLSMEAYRQSKHAIVKKYLYHQ